MQCKFYFVNCNKRGPLTKIGVETEDFDFTPRDKERCEY